MYNGTYFLFAIFFVHSGFVLGIYVQYLLLHLLFSIKKRPHPVRIILHLLCVICIHVFMETIRVCSEKQQIYFLGQQTQVIWSTKFSECKLTIEFFSNILTYLKKTTFFRLTLVLIDRAISLYIGTLYLQILFKIWGLEEKRGPQTHLKVGINI